MSDLATKYRPYTFDDVIGQDSAVATLKGKLSSPSASYLLHGPKGSGKTSLARIFARMINCRAPSTCTKSQPCVSCEAVLEGRHPDIQEVNTADSRGIDDIRRLIETSRYAPANSYRVYILDEVHQLTNPAQSALLKPFEEPSRRTVWILCTTNPEKILSTVTSRMLPVGVSLLSPEHTAQVVGNVATSEQVSVPPEILTAIIESSGGHARNAVKALETYIAAVSVGGNPDIRKIAQKIQASSPLILALSYMQGQVMKEPARVFSAVQMADNKYQFLTDVIDIYRALIYKASGATELFQAHKYGVRLAKVTTYGSDVGFLAYQMNEHIEALHRITQHTLTETDVVDSVAAKCYATPRPVPTV